MWFQGQMSKKEGEFKGQIMIKEENKIDQGLV